MEIKNLGQLINHLATKAGIPFDDQHLKDILSNAELTKVTLHSDLVKALDENLLSVDAAGDNHPTIGAKYKSQALNAFDKVMARVIDELGLDEATKTELIGERNSYKRFETIAAKIKDLKNEKSNAGSKEEKTVLQKQIDELVEALRIAKSEKDNEKTKYEELRTKDQIDFKLRAALSGVKTIFDQLDPEVRYTSLITVINKELQNYEAELKYDEKGNLQPSKKDGSKLLGSNHTPITLQSLIDTSLTNNKLLAVSTASNQAATTGTTTVAAGKTAEISGTNQSVANYARKQREAFAKNTATQAN
ncbi:MAG: hypothetical protein IPJ81_00655 [Chitinophagaceae bacterium]|nr:hypothetical protein [Chitinophagaceae bacterium]